MAASSSTAASTSTSVNPNSTSNPPFDVFINHRGPDVKNTFASYLYHRLNSFGLKVFLDREELQQGEYFNSQIEGAIRTASVHVAIFSARYAESTWCLNELLTMLESQGTIIPVFYHVKPSELRWTEGKDGRYARALQNLKQKRTHDQKKPRHDSATIEQWRNALSTVSQISGFELESNSDEGALLEKVVERVMREVKRTPLNVAKYPTGLDVKVRDFENKVLSLHQHGERKPQVVGIVGLGGVGKTTLAKELFNGKSSHYTRSCFLDDVRENVGKGSLTMLQNKLLSSLIGSGLQVGNKDEGIEMLKKHLSSHQILLVLDDVDNVDQVDALVPNRTCIHPNSLILITTRDKDVLTGSGIEESSIYKQKGLNKQHSLELFCCHALGQPYPQPQFEDLAVKFVNACDGLPLSLKVFGALLAGKNERSYWEMQLKKLENILPKNIEERLRISYDALDEVEKQIFLDVACFFNGENRDTAITIWNVSDWDGCSGLRNIQNKCLVEVVETNRGKIALLHWPRAPNHTTSFSRIWDRSTIRRQVMLNGLHHLKIHMHDHLRDMGRHIALSSLPRRLWHWNQSAVDNLLHQSSEIIVRGIRMDERDYLHNEEFEDIQMRRLQLVDTEGSLLERILTRVKSPNLTWLRWKDCPYSCLPTWVPMKNLRVLNVSGDKLETLWQDEPQLPVYLEELLVDGCMQLKSIPGLAQLRKLRRLDVSGCHRLEQLSGLQTLAFLEELRAAGCVELKILPGSEKLTSLRKLDVSCCFELEVLPNMETMSSLEDLYAVGCTKLKSLRGSKKPTSIRRLNVSRCHKLEEIPNMETMASLEELRAGGCSKLKILRGSDKPTSLRQLDVSRCYELEELPNMETMAYLEELRAEGCSKLKILRGSDKPTSLRQLDVSRCYELEELPNMETMAYLEELRAEGCSKLKILRGSDKPTSLRQLDVSRCYELEELPNMETMAYLEELRANGCRKLKILRGSEKPTSLRQLDVSGCYALEELPNMETMASLEELRANGCIKLKILGGSEKPTSLRHLDVSYCYELEELPNMETMVRLEALQARDCVQLKSIQGLSQATKLRELNVSGCFELEELPSMETMVCLEALQARDCVQLKSIQGLLQATKLRELNVSGCFELEELPSMQKMVSLEVLSANGCGKLKSLRGLEEATKLRRLDVRGCFKLKELRIMENLVSLKELLAERCMTLKNIRGLEQATNLQLLDVNWCFELEELPRMDALVSLEVLRAGKCKKLKSIRGLENATKLRVLNVPECYELHELPSMETFVSLNELWVSGCWKVKRIRGLLQCAQLRTLRVCGCFELEEVESIARCMKEVNVEMYRCPKLQCLRLGVSGWE